jgi:WD40 repeat protein
LLVHGTGFALEVRRLAGAPLALRGHRALISHVEWSRDSRTLYSSSFDGTLRRWDTRTGTTTALIEGTVPVRGFAVAADGRIAAQVGDAVVLVHADGTSETLGAGPMWCTLMAQFERVRDRLLLQRCDHSMVMVDGTRLIELATDGYAAVGTAVSPDGERIAGAMNDRTVRVWDATTGRVLAVLRGHSDLVLAVAFSPDGTRLASASYDKTIRIWQLGTSRHRVLRGHSGPVGQVAWHGAGELVTASYDGTVRVWPVPATELPSRDDIAARLDAATTARIDANDRATTTGG